MRAAMLLLLLQAAPVELETLDGRRFAMSNYGERALTGVVFLSARCAASEAAAPALEAINAKHRLRGVLLVGVFPNAVETGAEIREFAQSAGLLFPVYRDPAGAVARRFGAKLTPEAVLLDRTGAEVYRGAVSGLAQAIEEALAGRTPEARGPAAEGTPIGQPGARREHPNRYGAISFSSELIFEQIPGAPAHHASTIAEAANGDLVAVWYGGSYESSDDQALFLARRRKGERAWSKPQALVRDSLNPPGNAVVFRDVKDQLWIIWARMTASRPLRRGGGWGETTLMFRTSPDNGIRWTEDRRLIGDIGGLPRNPPIVRANGEILLPLGGRGGSFFAQSVNGGRTWRRLGFVPRGGQPAAAERADGSILMLMRASPRILQSESADGGRTWSEVQATEFRNPNAGISLARLKNGHLVLAFNDSEKDRTPLSVARSTDGGKTWERPLVLEANPGEYSYPCIMQSADGKIHLTYTFRRYSIKHVEFNEDWLAHTERPN
jgi:predicted neuraminidase